MMRRTGLFVLAVVACLCPAALAAEPPLRIVQAGPTGELAQIEQVAEVRVVFSEPMVVLGRIPDTVRAPFFRISPSVQGSFRWSGTNTLIFTPREKLPFAARYEVTVAPTAASVASHRLEQPYVFSFTTPTVRLLRVNWYRRGRSFDGRLVIGLRFNQPVRASTLLPHVSFRYASHPWTPPALPAEGLAHLGELDPRAEADFAAKVAATQAATRSREAVAVAPASDWDHEVLDPGADLVVVETERVPPTDSWIRVVVDPEAPGIQGPETPGKEQEYVLKLEPTFFVTGFRCSSACDPDAYNPLRLRAPVQMKALMRTLVVRDLTDAAAPVALPGRKPGAADEEAAPADYWSDDYRHSSAVGLDRAGYSLLPGRSYDVAVDRGLRSLDGQTLGYTWVGRLENWHQSAFTSFGSGHGVWEASGGPELPFYARNLEAVTQWVAPVRLPELMPTLLDLQGKSFRTTPPGEGLHRRLRPVADEVQSYGIDLRSALGSGGAGLAWAALEDGSPIPQAHAAWTGAKPESTLVQVTNLGISVKDSPANTLVFVTRLDDGQPVEGARVAIRTRDNQEVWSGVTGADGVAMAVGTDLRDHDAYWKFRFIVTAEKDGDVAYAASDWNEGVEPWFFGLSFDLDESRPLLRGSVFSDRGVYRLGEEVHFKAILRSDTTHGIVALPAGTEVELTLEDNEGEALEKKTLALDEWGGADGSYRLPEEGSLGSYTIAARVTGQQRAVVGRFLVAAYRRPDFRVDASLGGESSLAGVGLEGIATGSYLFGAPMARREVRWSLSRTALWSVPAAITERYPEQRYAFLLQDWYSSRRSGPETVKSASGELDAAGKVAAEVGTDPAAGVPYLYTFEAEVTDVSRQALAGRDSFRVDPAPWYLGVARPAFFSSAASGAETALVAVGLDGRAVAGVPVTVTLSRIQWHSVRRAEGKGFYTWETERKEVPSGEWKVTTGDQPAPLHLPTPEGGAYVLKATAADPEGRTTTTTTSFYVLGPGYTAWERYDHNRIDLVPEKKTYRPGEVARILIKSPWESATALLTTEREGIRSHRTFPLTSTQQTVELPIAETDIPNLFVSVLLVKGRTGNFSGEDASDPGKPAFRLGYAELKVEDASKRLTVSVAADRQEYRPASRARVEVQVKDKEGRGAPSAVTLWAVDYGVLSLTAYRTPDVLSSVWVDKALEVLNEDSRQRLVSRRAIVPKGGEAGGGGGLEQGPGTPVRKDFRVLAFWLGSVATDPQGHAVSEVTLPEDLTTYRIMAVAGDVRSRFGRGESEIRISKPVLLKPAFPRFLALGDRALFGAVVHSQLPRGGSALVTMRSLDTSVLEVLSNPKQTLDLAARGAAEARFQVAARGVGRGRLQMSVKLLGEGDAFEDTLPVEVLASPETVAAYGEATPEARETVELPSGVVAGYGGLSVELSSTAMVGLGEGARYLVDYPYGCAEQRASSALALVLAADLGDAFRLPGIEPATITATARETLKDLEAYQCADGGFVYWKGSCPFTSPYLTSYVLHVYQRAQALGHPVKAEVLDRGYGYLERELGRTPPTNEGWWPAFTSWQAFAVKVLAEGGRNVDSHVTRLFQYLDRMPVFALTYLKDALAARGETGERDTELDRRIRNAILPEGGTGHVEELADPYLLWFWNSNIRSTALALGSLVRTAPDEPLATRLVRWLMKARKRGRWGNTQENATAMEALVDYYKKYEATVPDFRAVVSLGLDTLAQGEFRGRSSEVKSASLAMKDLLARGEAGTRLDLGFRKQGAGTLFYAAWLRYAADALYQTGLDDGFSIRRTYGPVEGDGAVPVRSFKAGDLVRVSLEVTSTKERRYVAVTDPLPAGFEPVESWFATTASDLAREQREEEAGGDWTSLWRRGGFDHVERHDDRVLLFATRLSEGSHTFSYIVRATTAGTFRTAPAHVQEMYEPEVFGRTATDVIEVRP